MIEELVDIQETAGFETGFCSLLGLIVHLKMVNIEAEILQQKTRRVNLFPFLKNQEQSFEIAVKILMNLEEIEEGVVLISPKTSHKVRIRNHGLLKINVLL